MGRIQTFLGFVAITLPIMANPPLFLTPIVPKSHTHSSYRIMGFLSRTGIWILLIHQREMEHVRVVASLVGAVCQEDSCRARAGLPSLTFTGSGRLFTGKSLCLTRNNILVSAMLTAQSTALRCLVLTPHQLPGLFSEALQC